MAKGLIHTLNNKPLREGDEKTLIVDFALEDARKLHKQQILKDLKKRNMEEKNGQNILKKELGKKFDKKNKFLNENNNDLNLDEKSNKKDNKRKDSNKPKENVTPVNEISDEKALIKMFYSCVSRGKKQRVKKRLMEVKKVDVKEVEAILNESKLKYKPKTVMSTNKNKKDDQEQYRVEVVDNERTNINKQSKKLRRNERSQLKKDDKMLSKKRKKDQLNEKEDEEEINGGMNQYFRAIEEKLKTYKD